MAGDWLDQADDDDLETFLSFDTPTRRLILHLLGCSGEPGPEDYAALGQHPQGRDLAAWLLTVPYYEDWTFEDFEKMCGGFAQEETAPD